MKIKHKNAPLPVKTQNTTGGENTPRQDFWKRIGLRLAAIFLIIVFLASECATLLPVE